MRLWALALGFSKNRTELKPSAQSLEPRFQHLYQGEFYAQDYRN
jgi:hypothetical protein